MRWLVSPPWWVLAGAFVLLLLSLVFGLVDSWVIGGIALVVLFLLFFATLMVLVARRETPRPPSPH